MNNKIEKHKKAKVETHEKCCICRRKARLQLENSSWICNSCAQVQSELGHESS